MFKETPFTKAQRALQDSNDVRKDLSDLRDIYWALVSNSIEVGSIRTHELGFVAKMATNRLKLCLEEIQPTQHIQKKQRIADQHDTGPIVVDDVDFLKEGDDQVKVKLVCGCEEEMFYINVNPRRMNDEEQREMKENLIPTDMKDKIFVSSTPPMFWNIVLAVRTFIGDEAEIQRNNEQLGYRTFAGIFGVSYFGIGNIKIFVKDGCCRIQRDVVAVLCRVACGSRLFALRRGYMRRLTGLTEVSDLPKQRFWDAVTAHFAVEIEGALQDPPTADYVKAIQEEKAVKIEVAVGFTVTTVLTRAEQKDNGTVVISVVSTFPVPDNLGEVRVCHKHSMPSGDE
eukprot:GHVS01087895.1.p1 GENE.GHVS01087895.1~~GHVS01087895.1.p1  ORF type:complete len:341 (+),score=46.70 GHVS01087895.1:86-1108(+)